MNIQKTSGRSRPGDLMADATKSALFVDYESINRSLTGDAANASDARLAERAEAWLAALERGQLVQPAGRTRRLVIKRAYAGPSVGAKPREALAAAGFDVIDVGAQDSSRNSADLHMAMDIIDTLAQPDGCNEFILLTASAELEPLLNRLRANRRTSTIYVDASTADTERNRADATLDGTDLAIFLAAEDPASGDERKTGATDRSEIEAFARRIHAATNIPLFSPKTYSELFQHLTEEIAENGYHFQETAQNVAQRMTAAGRTVNRRQIVFIVKGLALKGHVFSTTDTPQRLAEVFREQARYLISNAGLGLNDHEDRMLTAWIMSRSRPAAPAQAVKPAAPVAKAAPPPAPQQQQPPQQQPQQQQPQQRPSPQHTPRPPEKAKAAAEAAPARAPSVKPVDMPKSTAPKPAASVGPSTNAREEAKAIIAARIADAAKLKPGRRLPKATPRPPASPQAPAAANGADPLESSILAAIAQAVDVLVDDDANANGNGARKSAKKAGGVDRQEAEKAAEAAFQDFDDEEEGPPPEIPADGNDIGDQIQRIIASYNRNRTNE